MSLILCLVSNSLTPSSQQASNIHTSRTAGNLPAFLQAIEFPSSIGLILALHKVIIISLAPVPDKVGRAQQERRCGTNLLNLGDVGRHRRGVHQDLLVESVRRGQEWLVSDSLFWEMRDAVEGRLRVVGTGHTEDLLQPL